MQGLRDLGYVEGKNIDFVLRTTEGKSERYTDLAAELVRLNVDIIVVGGNSGYPCCQENHQHNSHCHAICRRSCSFRASRQPRAARWQHHGVVSDVPRLDWKTSGVAQGDIAQGQTSGLYMGPGQPGTGRLRFKEAQAAAGAAGIMLQSLEVRRSNELATAFAAAAKDHAEALVVPVSMARIRKRNRRFCSDNYRLPWTCDTMESVVQAACLMAYGPSYPDLHRRAAVLCGLDSQRVPSQPTFQ